MPLMPKTLKEHWSNKADRGCFSEYYRDTRLWMADMYPAHYASAQGDEKKLIEGHCGLMRRFFLTMEAGLKYRTTETGELKAWDKPLAAVLGHGGRVMICAKRGLVNNADVKHWFWSFFLTGNPLLVKSAMYKKINNNDETANVLKYVNVTERTGSTHGLSEDGSGNVIEKHGWGQNITRGLNPNSHLFGCNPAIGGVKGENSKGHPIKYDGGHGHIHILYRTFDNNLKGYGSALLIGCENIDHTVKPGYGSNGELKEGGSKTHLAMAHGLGEKMKFSATNGHKWGEVKDVQGVPAEYNGMLVIVDQDVWDKIKVAEKAFQKQTLQEQFQGMADKMGWAEITTETI